MWNRLILVAGMTVTLASAAAAQSDIPCWCRDNSGQHPLGTILCMRVGDSERLVRCERVQNNTSWRTLSEGCPTAAAPPATPAPTAHARL
tara:strand:+ start:1355 stop:1624 length:270 start_codon:yes stop_codon:yes gene_type:complete